MCMCIVPSAHMLTEGIKTKRAYILRECRSAREQIIHQDQCHCFSCGPKNTLPFPLGYTPLAKQERDGADV
jgi:hypothetical protein